MVSFDTLRGSALALIAALAVPACAVGSGGETALDDNTNGAAGAAAESAATAEQEPKDPYAERETRQDPSREDFNGVAADPDEALTALAGEGDPAEESAEALAAAPAPESTGDDVAQSENALTTTTSASNGTISYRNARGETIKAHYQLPAGASSLSKVPAVIVMHGSGGMHKMPSSDDRDDGRVCSPKMESQFPRWADRLTKAGYAVLIPDSWEARGYCDESGDSRRKKALPEVDGDENGKTRRLLWRIYDMDAGARWLCTQSKVNCDRIATLGFSNGGSAVMLGLHHKINDVLRAFRDRVDLNFRIPLLPGNFPYKRGIAYYPGCGFDGIMKSKSVSEYFYPRAPLRILMGENDSLIDNCAESEGDNTREYQADKYAETYDRPDRYTIKVYPDVNHGYDSSDCSSDGNRDERACYDSKNITMKLFTTLKQ